MSSARRPSLSQQPKELALTDIDWRPRRPQTTLDRLAGPDGSPWEVGLTLCALVGTCAVAHTSALATWSALQYTVAITLAAIDGSAAVQTSTGMNKRWYHEHGQLRPRTALIIGGEAALQAALIGLLFCDGAEAATFAWRAALWFGACTLALMKVPLHAQRPLSVLLLLASLALSEGGRGILPRTPGLGWARLIFPVKYIVSHPVRHEPYRVDN
jgi:hypothetical protein